jgi:hypothetical protein
MGYRLPAWGVTAAIVLAGAYATASRCPGCLPRDRVNTGCQWTGDATFVFDGRQAAHRIHLVEDAQLAEELGIRFADAEFKRRSGRVEHHGGLLDGGRVRGECLSQMFAAIEQAHGVTAAQVQAARGERNGAYDAAVALLFVPVYLLGAAHVARRIQGRFAADVLAIRLTAIGLASAAATLLGTLCFRLWGAVWEVMRVGNGHMTSIRAASSTRWTAQHPGMDVLVGIMLFLMMAVIVARRGPAASIVTDGPAPGLTLR